MNCPKCNSPLAADATSCPVCNTPVQPMSQASEGASQQTFQQASPAHQNDQQQPGTIPPKEKVQAMPYCSAVKKYGLLAVAGLFVLIVCLCLFTGSDGKKEYEKGKEAGHLQAYKTAAYYYKVAAKKGNTDAMKELGTCYEYGWGVDKDSFEAVKWYRKAAEKGNAQAMSYLGYCYEKGDIVPQNINESEKWYRKAFETWQKAAEKGDPNAMESLGARYKNGEGVPKDFEEAEKWYRLASNTLEKAAEKGNIEAMYKLSSLYEYIYGDEDKAFKWCCMAAEKGNVEAIEYIALSYSTDFGRMGLRKNENEAFKWWLRAAEKGNANAMFHLGSAYSTGEVVEENQKEAVRWYRKAAEKGSVSAMFSLGLLYEYGEGVDISTKEAVKWYRKGAEEDDVSCTGRLRKIAQKGYPDALKALEYLEEESKRAERAAEKRKKAEEKERRKVEEEMVRIAEETKRAEEEERRRIEEEKARIAEENIKQFTTVGIQLPGNIRLKLVKVEAGVFTMGQEEEGHFGEKPHTVTLKHDYYIGETEVTQAQWEALSKFKFSRNPSEFHGDDLPVSGVSWKEATGFCEKLNEMYAGKLPVGYRFDLPSEAQWEYAARGGNKSQGYKYSGSNDLDTVAWYSKNSDETQERGIRKTHPVGTKQPNELGLYDMSGNVGEWCRDTFKRIHSYSPYADYSTITDYSDDPECLDENVEQDKSKRSDLRVIRGGSYLSFDLDSSNSCRVGFRDMAQSGYNGRGFRLALVPFK